MRHSAIQYGIGIAFGITLALIGTAHAYAGWVYEYTVPLAEVQAGTWAGDPTAPVRLRVEPGAAEVPLRLKAVHVTEYAPLPAGVVAQSDVFDITVTHEDTSQPLFLKKELKYSLRMFNADAWKKDLMIWNATAQKWDRMRSVMTGDRWYQEGASWRTPVRVVAVTDRKTIEGRASWYRAKRADDAASNDFALGTKLRVTHTPTGKTTVVTVRSTGPFVPGRVLDIDRRAFSSLLSPGAGTAQISVTPVQ